VNTRTKEIEINHSENTSSETEALIKHLQSVTKGTEIDIQLMRSDPEAIITSLLDWVLRDVQSGWYEGDEWLSASKDCRDAVYYRDGEESTIN